MGLGWRTGLDNFEQKVAEVAKTGVGMEEGETGF